MNFFVDRGARGAQARKRGEGDSKAALREPGQRVSRAFAVTTTASSR
jgi:hypothetical protein